MFCFKRQSFYHYLTSSHSSHQILLCAMGQNPSHLLLVAALATGIQIYCLMEFKKKKKDSNFEV